LKNRKEADRKMVESNVVTVTYQAVVAVTLNLQVSMDTKGNVPYDPAKDTIWFMVTASADCYGKAVKLIVDGQDTGLMNNFGNNPVGDRTHVNIVVSPSNMPSQLKTQGSHSCKVVSVGW